MAAMTDLANPAAAVTAGYSKTQINRGTAGAQVRNPPLQYVTIFEKMMVGEPGCGASIVRAVGESSVDAATADTNALAILNGQRTFRYGKGANQHAGALPANAAFQHTVDVT